MRSQTPHLSPIIRNPNMLYLTEFLRFSYDTRLP
jgi:hypothetical protein